MPAPNEHWGRGYLSEFTYYYRSSYVVLIVVWLGTVWQGLGLLVPPRQRARELVTGVGVTLCLLWSVAHFGLFHDLNHLVRLIHSDPLLFEQLNTAMPDPRAVAAASGGPPLVVERVVQRQVVAEQFSATYARLFGDDFTGTKARFMWTFERHPFAAHAPAQLPWLLGAFYPYDKFEIETRDDEAVPRDRQRIADMRALYAALTAYYQRHGRYPCTQPNGWLWSTDGPNWLRDDPAACDARPLPPLTVDGSTTLPVDPTNTPGAIWNVGATVYGYRGWRPGCPMANGQFFLIGTQLETLYREVQPRPPTECTGGPIPWPRQVYALSSLDALDPQEP